MCYHTAGALPIRTQYVHGALPSKRLQADLRVQQYVAVQQLAISFSFLIVPNLQLQSVRK